MEDDGAVGGERVGSCGTRWGGHMPGPLHGTKIEPIGGDHGGGINIPGWRQTGCGTGGGNPRVESCELLTDRDDGGRHSGEGWLANRM